MIGITLSLKQLTAIARALPSLFDAGVRQVELQCEGASYEQVMQALITARRAGFSVSLYSSGTDPDNTLQALERVAETAEQESIPLVLGVDWQRDNSALYLLKERISEKMLPLIPVIECRDKREVVALLDRLDVDGLNEIAICLDLAEDALEASDMILIDKRLQRRLICIRVTDTAKQISSSLREQLSALSWGFHGSYNITLSSECEGNEDALLTAVSNLYGALPLCAKLYDDIRLHFDERFQNALTVWDQPAHGTYFSLIHSTAFLFQTNGFRWAMDIAFRNTYRLAKLPHEAATLLKDLELMIISHEHGDHFEERTVRRLAENRTQWIIPEFLVETALARGLRQEQIIVAHAGEALHIGPLTVLPFEGRHFRPVTGKGVPSYGYYITAPDAPSLAFPGDTRNFSLEGLPDLPKADWCFANVWLGDKSGFLPEYGNILKEYAAYMLRFSQKNILFAHLYECNRKPEDMWRKTHARLIAKAMCEICPDIQTHIPMSGDLLHLV